MIKYSAKKNQSGLSLVEVMIYSALLAVFATAVISSLIVFMRSFAELRTNQLLFQNGQTAIERMSREIRAAASVGTSTSVFGSSPGILALNESATSSVSFYVNAGAIALGKNGAYYGSLTNSSAVSIESLIFRKISTPKGDAIKIELSIKDITRENGRVENFYDTIALRPGI